MANKSVLINSLNIKVKQKVGLINKIELASVVEDMINEVYSNAVIDTDVTATHTSISDSSNYSYKIVLKKVGNLVTFNAFVYKKYTGAGTSIPPFIQINNVDFLPLTGEAFYFSSSNPLGEVSIVSVASNKISFAIISDYTLYVTGQYITNNN